MGWVMGEPVLGSPPSCCRSHRDEGSGPVGAAGRLQETFTEPGRASPFCLD